jgi:hypothetical protein
MLLLPNSRVNQNRNTVNLMVIHSNYSKAGSRQQPAGMITMLQQQYTCQTYPGLCPQGVSCQQNLYN